MPSELLLYGSLPAWLPQSRFHYPQLSLKDHFGFNEVVKMESQLFQFWQNGEEQVLLTINSTRGSILAASHLTQVIDEFKLPVCGYVIGDCDPAAFFALQFCPIRAAIPDSRVTIGNPWDRGSVDPDDDPVVTLNKLAGVYHRRMARSSHQSLVEMLRRKATLTAYHACRIGALDAVHSLPGSSCL